MAGMEDVLDKSEIPGLKLAFRGKVRDVYDLGDALLIVTTDRLSAFDVVLPTPIPGKGRVLASLSRFWFGKTRHIVPNHLLDRQPADVVPPEWAERIQGRADVVRKVRALPVEAVVRGYLAGSGWTEYRQTGTVCGIALPPGLQEAERLPEPIFTPARKAEQGEHDENITFERAAELIGRETAERVRDISLALYRFGAEWAQRRGILIADTKFEFGVTPEGELILIDEVLTPDSSRFWPADSWRPGQSPPSFDKQYVRDYLTSSGWDRRPPAPELPPSVVANTAARYREALRRLTAEA